MPSPHPGAIRSGILLDIVSQQHNNRHRQFKEVGEGAHTGLATGQGGLSYQSPHVLVRASR